MTKNHRDDFYPSGSPTQQNIESPWRSSLVIEQFENSRQPHNIEQFLPTTSLDIVRCLWEGDVGQKLTTVAKACATKWFSCREYERGVEKGETEIDNSENASVKTSKGQTIQAKAHDAQNDLKNERVFCQSNASRNQISWLTENESLKLLSLSIQTFKMLPFLTKFSD